MSNTEANFVAIAGLLAAGTRSQITIADDAIGILLNAGVSFGFADGRYDEPTGLAQLQWQSSPNESKSRP